MSTFNVIVYYPKNHPGKQYQIVGVEELEDTWDLLEKGVRVSVLRKGIRTTGVIVSVSDDLQYLENNLKSMIADQQQKVLPSNQNIPEKKHLFSEYPRRKSIKIEDNAIRIKQYSESQLNRLTHVSIEIYKEMEKENKEVKSKHDRARLLFSDVCNEIKHAKGLAKLINHRSRNYDKQPLPSTSSIQKDNSYCSSSSSEESHVVDIARSKQMVQIGSKGTKVPRKVYNSINWASYTGATRTLLMALFSRATLATHSLSGKPSPAFSHKREKKRLNPAIINDIVEIVSKKSKVQQTLVRKAVTVKCADECKLSKKRAANQRKSLGTDNN